MEQISETYDGIPMPSKEQEDIAEAQNISLPFACRLKCKLGYQGELVKEKDEENERLCGIITGLLAEKEKDNVDKHTMLNRMSQIEALLTAIVLR
ncbi:uncharacterized protein LOC110910036 isoform X2 [Helianthus annuus]|nr:uncharacterized protein LOC110910036 isoform X2 [Helianthus annuus]